MANVLPLLRTAIYSKLIPSGSNAFKTAISSKLYYHIAPQGEALPYAVFDILLVPEERDTASKFSECTVQFLLAASTLGGVETITTALMSVLDDSESSFTLTGGATCIEVTKQFQSQPLLIEGVWQNVVQYKISVQI